MLCSPRLGKIDRLVQAEHNAFLLCDNFEQPSWVELLPTEGPDSDAFDPEREPVMDCRLVLTALWGVTLNVSLSIAKFDRFADLEDHVIWITLSQ